MSAAKGARSQAAGARSQESGARRMAKEIPAEAQLALALAACRSIRFAVTQAARYGGEFSLNDILAADILARDALGIGKKGGSSAEASRRGAKEDAS